MRGKSGKKSGVFTKKGSPASQILKKSKRRKYWYELYGEEKANRIRKEQGDLQYLTLLRQLNP
ncbi:MAG: hypothetical protein ACOC22_03880 [bacterium]